MQESVGHYSGEFEIWVDDGNVYMDLGPTGSRHMPSLDFLRDILYKFKDDVAMLQADIEVHTTTSSGDMVTPGHTETSEVNGEYRLVGEDEYGRDKVVNLDVYEDMLNDVLVDEIYEYIDFSPYEHDMYESIDAAIMRLESKHRDIFG